MIGECRCFTPIGRDGRSATLRKDKAMLEVRRRRGMKARKRRLFECTQTLFLTFYSPLKHSKLCNKGYTCRMGIQKAI